jgi:hypothetical protein
MKKFEKPSQDECRELVHRIHGKTVDEIIAMFGPPARELGFRKEERLADGLPRIVEFRRTVVFHGVGKTIHTLIVAEQTDGQLEFRMQGKEIVAEHSA